MVLVLMYLFTGVDHCGPDTHQIVVSWPGSVQARVEGGTGCCVVPATGTRMCVADSVLRICLFVAGCALLRMCMCVAGSVLRARMCVADSMQLCMCTCVADIMLLRMCLCVADSVLLRT